MQTLFGIKSNRMIALFIAMLLGISLWAPLQPTVAVARNSESNQATVVVLTASWCGTCREIIPVVQRVANSASQPLQVVILDVDDNSSPNRARQYGITITGSDVPQVYLFNEGKTTLLFSGENYKFGKSQEAERQIRQQIESSL